MSIFSHQKALDVLKVALSIIAQDVLQALAEALVTKGTSHDETSEKQVHQDSEQKS